MSTRKGLLMYLLVLLFSILTLDTLPLFASISFTNQAAAAVALPGASNGAAFGDYDEDGQPDLLVLPLDGNEPVRLYRNQGDGRFAESSQTPLCCGADIECRFCGLRQRWRFGHLCGVIFKTQPTLAQ